MSIEVECRLCEHGFISRASSRGIITAYPPVRLVEIKATALALERRRERRARRQSLQGGPRTFNRTLMNSKCSGKWCLLLGNIFIRGKGERNSDSKKKQQQEKRKVASPTL